MPLETIDEFTFEEFGWLYEHHYEQKKEEYEVLAHVISVGYARTQTKKKIKLFSETYNEVKSKKITIEERKSQIEELMKKFG